MKKPSMYENLRKRSGNMCPNQVLCWIYRTKLYFLARRSQCFQGNEISMPWAKYSDSIISFSSPRIHLP